MAMVKLERKSFGDDTRASLKNNGDKLEGFYQGAETFDHKGKPLTKHRFKSQDGKTISVLGDWQLNEDMPRIPVGSYTVIVFTGKKPNRHGGTLNTYDIEFEAPESEGL